MKTENETAKSIVDATFKVHVALGPGLLESVYARVLSYELRKRGHKVETEVPVSIRYDGHKLDDAFRADMVIDDLLIVELKSVEQLNAVCKKQLITYLRLADKRLGLLINFGETYIKDGITRIVNGLPEPTATNP
jgi:GxxExxY protein